MRMNNQKKFRNIIINNSNYSISITKMKNKKDIKIHNKNKGKIMKMKKSKQTKAIKIMIIIIIINSFQLLSNKISFKSIPLINRQNIFIKITKIQIIKFR